MKGIYSEGKNIKRYLKNKVRFTLGLVITYLMTGVVSFSNPIENNEDKVLNSNEIGFSTFGNKFINNGTISGVENGTKFTGINGFSNSEITNGTTGKINFIGDYSLGINASDSKVLNDGEVNIYGRNVVGISLANSTGINNGVIKTDGIGGMGVLALQNSTFTNNGTIEVLGESLNNNSITSGIDAQGKSRVENNGTIKTLGWGAFGMRSNGVAVNGINGKIITSGTNGNGMYSQRDAKTDEGIIVNLGLVETTGESAVGMSTDRGEVHNRGYIKTGGIASAGMRINNGLGMNELDGKIETTGDGARGITVDTYLEGYTSKGINKGQIITSGKGANGIEARDSVMENSGTIKTTGEKARGIILKNSNGVNDTKGEIFTEGERAYGVYAYEGSSTINKGSISTDGYKSYGMRVANSAEFKDDLNEKPDLKQIYSYEDFNTKVSVGENIGDIKTTGEFSHGISATNGVSISNIGNIITTGNNSTGINLNFGSLGSNSKNVKTTGTESKGVSVISSLYQMDEVDYKINGNYGYSEYIFKTDKGSTFTNLKNGVIETTGEKSYGVYLESYFADEEALKVAQKNGVDLVVGEIPKSSVTNDGTIRTTGDKAYGIYAINSIVNNNGLIHTKGKGAYGIYAVNGSEVNHNGKIHVQDPDAYGIVYDSTSTINISKNAQILVNGSGANAIKMVENLSRTLSNNKSQINNYGNIEIFGEGAKGMTIYSQGAGINSGVIDINGANTIGMYADGSDSSISNLGTISLNLSDSSIAMMGKNGAEVINSGTIKLKDYLEDTLVQSKIDSILNVDKNSTFINTGVITNSQDKIVSAAGDEVGETVENIGQDEVYKSNNTVTITGDKLEGILNQGEAFDEDGKYLLKVLGRDNPLLISGTINAGKNGVEILENGKVDFSGNVNSLENAFNLNGAELSSTNGNIVGNIVLNGNNKISLSDTQLAGDIIGISGSNNNLSIEGNTSIAGNITFGDGDDTLKIDSTAGNLLVKETVIDGGAGVDTLILGDKGKLTVIKSTIKNFENNEFYGDVFLSSDAKIVLDKTLETNFVASNTNGDLLIADEGRLVLGVDSNGGHSLDSVSGNTINSLGSGKLIIQSDNLVMGNDGKYQLYLLGTSINVADENILASQFIYDISNTTPDILEISIKDLNAMGINGGYQSIFDSIVSSGNLSNLNSVNLGNEKELESLLNQISAKTPYSYSLKSSKDSMNMWTNQIKNSETENTIGQWTVLGGVVSGADSFNGKYSHNSNLSGLVAMGEYGVNSSISLGVVFGGGKGKLELDDNSSELKKDSFYIGGYSKKEIGNYRLLGSIGYQKDRYDSKRVLENSVDYFKFDKSYDVDGLNMFLQGGYSQELSNGVKIEPNLSFTYNYLSQEGIDEGDSPMSMKVDKENSNLYEGEVGIDLSKEMTLNNVNKSTIFIGGAYSYLGGDTDSNFKGQIGNGSKFDFKGPDFGGSFGKVSLGTMIENLNGYSYGLKAEYVFGENSQNVTGSLLLKYKF